MLNRCGANICADSDLDPILKFDMDGNVVDSFGGGRFTPLSISFLSRAEGTISSRNRPHEIVRETIPIATSSLARHGPAGYDRSKQRARGIGAFPSGAYFSSALHVSWMKMRGV